MDYISRAHLNAASLASSGSYNLTVPLTSFGGRHLGGSFIFFGSTMRCWSRPGILAKTPPLGVSLWGLQVFESGLRLASSGLGWPTAHNVEGRARFRLDWGCFHRLGVCSPPCRERRWTRHSFAE